MFCQNCGKPIRCTSKFCAGCGSALPVQRNLILGAMENDQEAYTVLYGQAERAVRMTVYSIISPNGENNADADDIIIESMVQGFKSLAQLTNPDSFTAWMRTIARNKSIDYLRRNRDIVFSELATEEGENFEDTLESTDVSGSPEASLDQKTKAALLKDILSSLPDDQRAVLVMYYYHEMKIGEIASELGCTEATVKSRLKYGKSKVESGVKDLEKKHGVKLYSVAPVLLILLFRYTEKGLAENAGLRQHVLAAAARTGAAATGATAAGAQAGASVAASTGTATAGTVVTGSTATGSMATGSTATGSMATGATAAGAQAGAGIAASAGAATAGTAASGAGGAAAAVIALKTKIIIIAAAATLATGAAGTGVAVAVNHGRSAKKASVEASTEAATEKPEATVASDSAAKDDASDDADSKAGREGDDSKDGSIDIDKNDKDSDQDDGSALKARSLVQSVETNGSDQTVNTYDEHGNVIRSVTSSGNAFDYTYEYDADGHVLSEDETGSNGDFHYAYTLRADGLPEKMVKTSPTGSGPCYTSTYSYTLREDGQPSECMEIWNTDWGSVETVTTDYTYDADGNLESKHLDYDGNTTFLRKITSMC